MTNELTPARQRQVEEYLGRKLEAHELVTVDSISDLAPSQRTVVETLALQHRLVCVLYLRGVVDGLLGQHAFDVVDAVRGPHL